MSQFCHSYPKLCCDPKLDTWCWNTQTHTYTISKDISAPTPETQPTPTLTMNVQVISAEWCKRCHVIKPEVAKVCALTQIPYNVLDFDELDEADKLTVKSLPTIRILRGGVVDSTYTASEFEAWKSVLMAAASGTKDEDF